MINDAHRKRLADTITLLNLPGIGRGRLAKLVKVFGTVEAVLGASAEKLCAVSGISRKLAETIVAEQDRDKAREITARIVQLGWKALTPDDDNYPSRLKEIDDRPALLFAQGELLQADEKVIAIVGTRHCSETGRQFTQNLAADLARSGIVVASGMAEGIDSAAHKGALEGGGRTVAIWGSSLDHVYPPANKGLAEKIKSHGAVYSEYLPDTRPDKTTFPDRNRIISGIADGVVVIEAGDKSGALITADFALAQDRELFAVPGPPDSRTSRGTNQLIKKGARLITSVEDIFAELPRLKGQILVKQFRQLPELTESEKAIVELFANGSLQVDQIARAANMSISEVMEFLLALELKGVITELSGKRFTLAEEFA